MPGIPALGSLKKEGGKFGQSSQGDRLKIHKNKLVRKKPGRKCK
jgi:hypothetical protein